MRIWFDEKVARYVQRRMWHPTQRFCKVADGVEMAMEVRGTTEVVSWVLGFGATARVLEPEGLREGVAREIETLAARRDS